MTGRSFILTAVFLFAGVVLPCLGHAQMNAGDRVSEVIAIEELAAAMVESEPSQMDEDALRAVSRVSRALHTSSRGSLRQGMWPSQNARSLVRLVRSLPEHGVVLETVHVEKLLAAYDASARASNALVRALGDPTLDLDILIGELVGAGMRIVSMEPLLIQAVVELEGITRVRGDEPSLRKAKKRYHQALGDPDGFAASLFPEHPDYVTLMDARPRYRAVVKSGGWKELPLGARLRVEGWLDPEMLAVPEAITEALKGWQKAHLLEPSGEVDPETGKALAVSAATRLGEIDAAMQKWRTSPVRQHGTFVRVNIPAYMTEVWRAGELVSVHRSVHGDHEGKTSELDRSITAVHINPSWYVPPRVMRRDLEKRAQRDPNFLRSNDIRTYVDSQTGLKRMMQPPGDGNWLGRVIFRWDARGANGIYIHDTPFQARFNRSRRAMSHGCVNLEGAVALARDILSLDGTLTEDEFDKVLASERSRRVHLKSPIPAFLEYVTVQSAGQGRLAFLPDVYGWNRGKRTSVTVAGLAR
jgi:hypothetical protein